MTSRFKYEKRHLKIKLDAFFLPTSSTGFKHINSPSFAAFDCGLEAFQGILFYFLSREGFVMKKITSRRTSWRLTQALKYSALAVAISATSGSATADEVAFDDFESLSPTMVPFSIDYFKDGRMPGEFDGWSLMDVSSWIGHAGVQAGRDRCYFGSDPAARNTAMVADPDEADDGGNTSLSGNTYNSYITRAYDVSGANLSALELSFDFDFITDGAQTGVVDVSFDGGTTWQNLLTMTVAERDDIPYGTHIPAPADSGVFTAVDGDFTAPTNATEMLVRFGCITAGNNWWFAFDNVGLTDGAGLNIFEDFEEKKDELLPFSAANPSSNSDGTDWSKDFPAGWVLDNSQSTYPTEQPDFDPSDGTDWTQDLSSVGWTIINNGPSDLPAKKMYYVSEEGAYNGGAVLDALSWSYQTDDSPPSASDLADITTGYGQFRSMFRSPFFGANNAVLVFDPDQSTDNILEGSGQTPPEGENVFNSFAQKTYDMSLFDNDSATITLDWEIRVEGPQNQLMQVSFDGGTTWTTVFQFDSGDLSNPDLQTAFLPYLDLDGGDQNVINNNDIIRTQSSGPQTLTVSDFFPNGNVPDSNTMAFRIGCIDAGNNWWFAVDEILVEANAQAFVIGDANLDGDCNFNDINAGFNQILSGTYSPQMDINEDGAVGFNDINGFFNAVIGN